MELQSRAADDELAPIVAIGASAGGIEALGALVSGLEAGTGTCYVVIQHLAPDHESILHEILGARTDLPVEQIEDGDPVRAERVFVVPPGRTAAIDGGVFRLGERKAADRVFHPIDRFFASLAAERGRDACCVVLSGTGTDGTAGLREVKAAGGYAIVQERGGARFPGMPDSAVATGMVDLVLPIREIAPRLREILSHRAEQRRDPVAGNLQAAIEAALPRIARRLAEVIGHDFSEYKPGTMIRRIGRQMVLRRTGDVEDYVRTVERDEEQAVILGREFLIGVTRFFRDPEAFEALRERAIGPILDGDGPTVRVWVPGCATGEEAYSIAILFLEEMRCRGDARRLQVFGTDIDTRALLAARHGAFGVPALEGMSEARRDAFFQPAKGGYRARLELREVCVFAPHNLLQDPPFSQLDLISCRNMLIYLRTSLQEKVIPRFHFSLRRGGMLLLGPSEGLAGNDDLFDTVDKPNRIFRRTDGGRAGYSSLSELPPRGPTAVRRGGPAPTAPAPGERARRIAAERAYLREHAAPFAVVAPHGEVRYLSHAMTRFVRPTQGVPSTSIDAYLADALREPARAALDDVAATGAAARVDGVIVPVDGERTMFDVLVAPMPGEGRDLLLTLREARPVDAGAIDEAAAGRDVLERENARLRRQLAAALIEHETSGEELTSTNEELTSMNEELQSSNEELETSREELQSINEEFETVNAELRENNHQLLRANSDLKNLFESTDVAVLFLDRAFSVRSFTPITAGIFGIRTRDIGRPIFDLASRIDYPELRADAAGVDASLRPVEREVRIPATEETFLLRMRPYRTTDDRIDGYVLSFFDITNRKRAEETLRRNERDLARQVDELENLYDTAPVGLSLIDHELRYMRVNSKLAEINGLSPEDHMGRSLRDLLPDIAEDMEQTYREVFETGEPILNRPVRAEFDHAPGETRHFITDLYPVFADGQVFAVGTCVRDVTEAHRLTAQIARSEARMKRLFDAAPLYIAIFEGPDHAFAYANPLYERLTAEREFAGRRMLDVFPEVDGQGVIERFDRVFETGETVEVPAYEVVFGRTEDDPRPRSAWFEQNIEPIRDADGRITGTVSFAYDVTEQIAARQEIERRNAHQRLLLGELQHRVKNTLATIRAISKMLLHGAPDARTYQERLGQRLGAIARTHDLLTDADWSSVTFEQVAMGEARPYAGEEPGRIGITGDPLLLTSRQATSLGMALHELMTNAAKYGALSNAAGTVTIDVQVRGGRASITWTERGGPPVAPPPADAAGFGTIVLERVLTSDLSAQVEPDYAPEGLRYSISFDTGAE